MQYKFVPPGNYLIWYIGSLGIYVRLAVTISLSCAILIIWYVVLHCPLVALCNRSASACTETKGTTAWRNELSALAQAPEPCIHTKSCTSNLNEINVQLLQFCEKAGLSIQSCTCHKPYNHKNISMQRLNLISCGTIAQAALFFDSLVTHAIPIADIECSFKKKNAQEYLITTTITYISA